MHYRWNFDAYPYLLGGKPSIGDFGMIAPLYGHLGRDAKPLAMSAGRGTTVPAGSNA